MSTSDDSGSSDAFEVDREAMADLARTHDNEYVRMAARVVYEERYGEEVPPS